MPETRLGLLINNPNGYAKTSDFKGKLLILDFWATWCSPCVAMIPKMDSLQKEFDTRIQFLPVTDQPAPLITDFLNKLKRYKKSDLPDVVQDTALNNLFPHTYLPHYVWITPNGVVAAITGFEEVSRANISALLNGSNPFKQVKVDIPVDGDPNKVFARAANGKTDIFHELVPGYQEDLPMKYTISPEDSSGRTITVTNYDLVNFYKLAFSNGKIFYGNNRVILQVKDKVSLETDAIGEAGIEWARHADVCSYEVRVPKGMGELPFKIMQEDLRNYYKKYDASVEIIPQKCLALVRTTTDDKIRTRGAASRISFDTYSAKLINYPIYRLPLQMQAMYMQNSPYPIIDRTGYKQNVDIEINAPLNNLTAVNKELDKYGLKFEVMELPTEMIVIKDHMQTSN